MSESQPNASVPSNTVVPRLWSEPAHPSPQEEALVGEVLERMGQSAHGDLRTVDTLYLMLREITIAIDKANLADSVEKIDTVSLPDGRQSLSSGQWSAFAQQYYKKFRNFSPHALRRTQIDLNLIHLTGFQEHLGLAGGQVWGAAQEMVLGPILKVLRGSYPKDSVFSKKSLQAAWREWWAARISYGTFAEAVDELAVMATHYKAPALWESVFRAMSKSVSREWICREPAKAVESLTAFTAIAPYHVSEKISQLRHVVAAHHPDAIIEASCAEIGNADKAEISAFARGAIREISSGSLFVSPGGQERVLQSIVSLLKRERETSPNKTKDYSEPQRDSTRLPSPPHLSTLVFGWGPLSEDLWAVWESAARSLARSSSFVVDKYVIGHESIPEARALEILAANPSAERRKDVAGNEALLKRSKVIRQRLLEEGQSKEIWLRVYEATTDSVEAGSIIEFLLQRNHASLARSLVKEAAAGGRHVTFSTAAVKELLLTAPHREDRLAAIRATGTRGMVVQGAMTPVPPRAKRVKRS